MEREKEIRIRKEERRIKINGEDKREHIIPGVNTNVSNTF